MMKQNEGGLNWPPFLIFLSCVSTLDIPCSTVHKTFFHPSTKLAHLWGSPEDKRRTCWASFFNLLSRFLSLSLVISAHLKHASFSPRLYALSFSPPLSVSNTVAMNSMSSIRSRINRLYSFSVSIEISPPEDL